MGPFPSNMYFLTAVGLNSQPKSSFFLSTPILNSRSKTIAPATILLRETVYSIQVLSVGTDTTVSFLFPETAFPQAKPQQPFLATPAPTTNSAGQAQYAPAAPTLASKLRILADKSLKRLAPIDISPEGKLRVVILDEVFTRGAEEHKDFIVG